MRADIVRTRPIYTSVKKFGTGGAHVVLPKQWVGKNVQIRLVEEPKKEEYIYVYNHL